MKRKLYLCFLLLFFLNACGKKGPPLTPLDTTPFPVNNLMIFQQGEKAILFWTLPRLTVDKIPLSGFKEIEIYSYSQSLSSLTPSQEEINLKEILTDRDWRKKVKKKAEKIFIITQSNKKSYVRDGTVRYQFDLELGQKPLNFRRLFSFAVKTISPKGQRSDWSNIAGIIPWAVPLPAQQVIVEVKEKEIEISWQPPQENIDGSQPVNVIGYNIYRRTAEDGIVSRINEELLLCGPQEWEYPNVSAIKMLQPEENKSILQLKVDKSTTSAYLYQDLTEGQNLSELRGKSVDISFSARILEEEANGSVLLDDGVNKWGSQNEKEMNLTNEWKEYNFNIAVDEKAIKLSLYIKPTRFPVDVTLQIEKVEAILKKEIDLGEEEEIEEMKEKPEEAQEKKEVEQDLETERIDLIRNGDFTLLRENKFSDMAFEFGKRYIYSVRAVNRVLGLIGESPDSQELEVLPLDTFPPAVPVGLSAITGAGIISLSWNANKEIDLAGYNIYRQEEGQTAFTLLNMEPLQKTIFQDDKVITGKVYIYAITALDNAELPNESAKSELIHIRAQ